MVRRRRRGQHAGELPAGAPAAVSASSPPRELTRRSRDILALILDQLPEMPQGARANGQMLADWLRTDSAESDVGIAGHVLSILDCFTALYTACEEEGQAEDAWRVCIDALSMAAIDLTVMDRIR